MMIPITKIKSTPYRKVDPDINAIAFLKNTNILEYDVYPIASGTSSGVLSDQ